METTDAQVGRVAEGQAGCLSRRQLNDLGMSDGMIMWRVATGRWRRSHPGVYTLVGVAPSWQQDVWAALLAAGPHVVVSHETALILHGVEDTLVARYPITLTARHGAHHRVSGAVVHQLDDVLQNHHAELGGLAVTTLCRAVVDVAAAIGQRRLRDLIDYVVNRRLTTISAIGQCMNEVARPRKPGIRRLARVLDSLGPGHVPVQSELERRLLVALEAAGLPAPVRQYPLPGRGAIDGLVDAAYPDARVVLEADGRRWHSRVCDLKRDHQRDAEAARVGWLTLRFTYEDIVGDPAGVAATVADVRRVRLPARSLVAT